MEVLRTGTKRRSKLALMAGATAVMLALSACGSGGGGEKAPEGGGAGSGFYAGKTIELVLGNAPGGSVDTTMRLFAKHLPRFLEGNPTMVVVNQENGGNTIVAANDYVANGSDDGLQLLGLGASNLSAMLFGNKQVEFRPNEDFTPLIGTTAGGVMVARADTGLKTGADLKDNDKELFLGGRRPNGSFIKKILGFEVLGVKVTELLGYEGASDINTAFLQGETNINGPTTSTFLKESAPEVEAGNQVVLYTEGYLDDNNEVGTDPALPDYPTIADVYEQMYGKAPSGPAWDAYTILTAADGGIAETLWVGKDAPQEAVDELSAAVDKMMVDPEFLADAKEILGDYPLMNGEETAAYVDANIINANRDGLDYITKMAKDRYGLDLSEG